MHHTIAMCYAPDYKADLFTTLSSKRAFTCLREAQAIAATTGVSTGKIVLSVDIYAGRNQYVGGDEGAQWEPPPGHCFSLPGRQHHTCGGLDVVAKNILHGIFQADCRSVGHERYRNNEPAARFALCEHKGLHAFASQAGTFVALASIGLK